MFLRATPSRAENCWSSWSEAKHSEPSNRNFFDRKMMNKPCPTALSGVLVGNLG
jgi:hypothetical protein